MEPYWQGFYCRLFKRIDPRYRPVRPLLSPEAMEEWKKGYRVALEIERSTPRWNKEKSDEKKVR